MLGYKMPLGKAMLGHKMPLGKAMMGHKMPLMRLPAMSQKATEEMAKKVVNGLERRVLKR
jgi:hypothetical protein